MQKYISSAIYNIRNELMGGRKPYRGGRGGRQTAGGRGARPQTSTDRKNSKDARPKSQPGQPGFPATAVPANGQAMPAVQYVQVPLPSAVNVAALAHCQTIDEKKQMIGNLIYPCIQTAFGDQFVGKITGMLLDEKVVNLEMLVTNQKYLSEIAGQAKNMLESQSKK